MHVGGPDDKTFTLEVFSCPECSYMVVEYIEHDLEPTGGQVQPIVGTSRRIIYPRSSRKAAPEVPRDIARDFEEAAIVLNDSPRAAAALGRRCLQHVLRERHKARGANLAEEIESVSDRFPPYITSSLHALRHIGNFAAHPIKDTVTGEIVDVKEGEAEWTIEALDLLLQFTFVGPARHQARLEALNEKLRAAGKGELPTIGVEEGST